MARSCEQDSEVSVWPLLYLCANWAGPVIDCFDLGVKLIAADAHADALNHMKVLVGPNARCPGSSVFDNDVQWLLAIPVGEEVQYADSAKLGISTREEVARALVDTFLLSLRLVRQTAAVSPVWFGAKVDEEGFHTPLDSDRSKDYENPWLDWDRPDVKWEETFEESDLVVLADVWDRLVECFSLRDFLHDARSEKFWQEIDRKATEQADNRLPAASPALSAEPALAEQVLPVFRQDELWQERHSEAFRNTLRARLDEAFLRATRIGRALSLFDEGLHLSPLHAFLSMCLVLETLFTLDEGELTHKLATRLAKVGARGGDADKTRDLHKRTKEVYKQRGGVVHGGKGIDAVPEEVQKDACDLARLSIRAILRWAQLLDRYGDPATSATRARKEKVKRLRSFFEDLDLGLDPDANQG